MADRQAKRNVEYQDRSSSRTQLTVAESETALEEQQASTGWFKKVYNLLSSSRQIFCLLCIFDFLFTFFLWIIYAQGVAVTGLGDSLSDEIAHYGISSSLFDIMIVSLVRVTILLLVYGYHVNKKIHTVAITTFLSTVYLLVKAFMFDFDDSTENDGNRPVDYILHIGSFLLCWMEAWYMQVKVLPKEKKAEAAALVREPTHSTLVHSVSVETTASTYRTIISFHDPPTERGIEPRIIRENLKLIETARKATSKALTFLYAENCWAIEKQKDGMLIESTTDEKVGKVLRVWASINANQNVVHQMIFGDSENVKKWNKSVTHIESIQKINSTTYISYSVIAEVAAGLISARDFVLVTHYQRIGEMYLSASTSIVTPLKPPVEGVVRGETILSSYALLPAEDDQDKSEFVWIITTEMKPISVPQMVVDHTMPGFLIDCVIELRKQCEQMKNTSNSSLL